MAPVYGAALDSVALYAVARLGGPMEAEAALGRWRPQRSIRRRLAAKIIVAMSRYLVEKLNTLEVENRESFDQARSMGRALITFSNHVSLFDDPWLVAAFSGSRWDDARWCATDALNFFGNPFSARLFSAGKGVPIVRGAGLDQPGMHFLEERLRDGDWVHIFPEGGRSRDPKQLRTPLKTGFAHLVKKTRPVVIPFHHTGMENVLPIGTRWPRTGNELTVRFGEWVDTAEGLADQSIEAITSWAEDRLLELEAASRGESVHALQGATAPVRRSRSSA
jgi:monolysocardiolipin acyltransferase